MALKPGRSDRQTLSALLLSGKVTLDEERAFRSMFNALENGQIRLTPPQRMWADEIYNKLKLDDAKPSKFKKLPSKPNGVTASPYDELVKNRPLKPPGK
jgi:hypothetical protein